jgi:hypothetical protein
LIGLICDTRSNLWWVLPSDFKGELTCLVTQYKLKDTFGVSPTVIQSGSVSLLPAHYLRELNFKSQTATSEHDQNERLQSLPGLRPTLVGSVNRSASPLTMIWAQSSRVMFGGKQAVRPHSLVKRA